MTLHSPRVAHDLPAGGRRLLQEASGYVATIVSGEVIRRNGVDTGARPGSVLRGARAEGRQDETGDTMVMLEARGDLVDRYGVRRSDDGPVTVPKARYIDAEYATLERRHLWPRVWQMACLTTDVAAPGDWIEYRMADQSIIVLRDLDGELRAFHNVCSHRGFKLCEGVGRADDGNLRCGYHGWRYDLDGAIREITSQRGFGLIERERYGLRPVRIASWEQMVFVNPAPDGMPLDEFLDPLPSELAPFALGERVCTFRCTLAMQGNWKVTVDAFNEVYHLQGLHPQLLSMMDDVHTTYQVFERGHSMMQIPLGVASPRLGGLSDEAVAEALHHELRHHVR